MSECVWERVSWHGITALCLYTEHAQNAEMFEFKNANYLYYLEDTFLNWKSYLINMRYFNYGHFFVIRIVCL